MYDFKFADIGEGIHEGQLLKWLFKVGDMVKEGETLCIIETDKVNAEIPSPVNGKITKLGAEIGETINVGETIVLIDTEDDNIKNNKQDENDKPVSEGSSGVVGEIEVSSDIIETNTEESGKQETNRVLATPVARKLAKDLNIDIKTINGTGENKRVLKDDIYIAHDKKQDTKSTINQDTKTQSINVECTNRVKISNIRKAIVKSMVKSKETIPHSTLFDEINVSALVEFRNTQKPLAEKLGVKLTYMSFIVKALTKTLEEFPLLNASFDSEQEEIIYKNYMNIGFAVDTPDGLMVPNIKNANKKSIFEIAKEIETLAKSAIERTIKLEQIQNGTFTITNFGAFDSLYGTPIIKHPEVAIIGIGKITKKPIVVNNEIIIADILAISLAFDHRIIDGADAGRFAMKFKEYITNPMLLLLS